MQQSKDFASSLPEDIEAAHAEIKRLRSEVAGCKQYAADAKQETHCFRELAEEIQEVFWMTNPLGDELIYISPAYEHIWGQSCEILYREPGRRLAWVHDEDRERVLKAFKRDAANGNYDEIFRIDRPDGGIRWIRDRAFPVYNESGEIYRLAGFAIDISDQVDSQDRIAKLQSLIATRERSSIFATLGTGLAHDLAQPLTSARNFIFSAQQLVQEEAPEGASLLRRAEAQVERASTIIRHLRDFAREGQPTTSTQALYPVLCEARDLLEPSLRAERVTLQLPDEQELAGIELPLDRVFIQQVLRNLICNSIEALAELPVSAQRLITFSVDASHADHVEVYVFDTGDGIGDDVDLFSSFATTKGEDGLGLGLVTSRSLARSHGGELALVSRGRGNNGPTCFVLRLPRQIQSAA